MADRITINVGGRRYETLASTLGRLPQSLLGDEQRRAAFWDASRQEFFFDRSSSSFEGIMLAYQAGGEPRRPAGVSEQTFLEDLRFFGLSERPPATGGGSRPPLLAPGWRGRLGAVVRGPGVATVSAAITVLSVLLFMLATVPSLTYDPDERDGMSLPLKLFWAELVCAILIFVEVTFRLVTNSRLVNSLRSPLNILDLVACLLFFFAAIVIIARDFFVHQRLVLLFLMLARLARLFRVFR